MKKFFAMKAKHGAHGAISSNPGRTQKVRADQHAGPRPRIRKQVIAPLVGPRNRGRAYQTRYSRNRRERNREQQKRDGGADIPLTAPRIDPVRGHSRGRTRKHAAARVSIPQTPAFVPLEIFSVKPEKKKHRLREEAPLGVRLFVR